jgi:PAS domain S-box-containing protein
MKNKSKTKVQLVKELAEKHKRITKLEVSEAKFRKENKEFKSLLDLIERAKQEWELAVDSLSQAICVLDKHGNIIRANLVLERWGVGSVMKIKGIGIHELFHGSTDESKGLKMHELFHPGCKDLSCYIVTLWSRVMEELTRNRLFEIEEDDRVLNRQLFFQFLPTQASKRGKSKVEAAFAVLILHDITDRKKAEAALEESEKRYRGLVETTTDAIVSLDLDTNIESWNKGAEVTLGYKAEEVVGKPMSLLVPNEFRDSCQKNFWDATVKGNIKGVETVRISKDGRAISVEMSLTTLIADDGEHIGYVTIIRDISDRKQAEEKLKKAYNEAALMTNLVENAHEKIFIVHSDGQIIKSNTFAREKFSYSPNDALPGYITSLFKFKTHEEWKKITDSIKRKFHWRGNLTAVRKDGQEFLAEVTFSIPGNSSGKDKKMSMICFVRDITEQTEADRMKSEFISIVSHELRTPLSITREGISLVLDRIPGKINNQQEELLGTAMRNIDRLARIINDLLDISKIEAGRVELRREKVDIVNLINKIILSFEKKIKDQGLELKTDFPEKELNIYGDEDKSVQVFTNVIANAITFTEKGSIKVSTWEKDNDVECVISDTGKGISKDDMPKLFSRFQQFGRTAGPGGKGTGLGLSIVKGLVEMHGGKIQVESVLNKGTTVTITLPKYTVSNVLNESVRRGVQEAADKGLSFSFLSINMPNFHEFERKAGKKDSDKLFKSLLDEIKNLLRRNCEVLVKGHSNIFVLLPETAKGGASIVAERIKRTLEDHIKMEDIKDLKGMNIDIQSATYPSDAETYSDLIKKIRR